MNNLLSVINKNQFHVQYDVSIKKAMSIMIENKNGCVVLVKNNKAIGILTESDIVNAVRNKINLSSTVDTIGLRNLIVVNQLRPIDIAFDILSKNNIRRLILVDDESNYVGVVIQEDLFTYLEEDVYKIDLKISNIIKSGKKVLTLDIKSSIEDALILMQDYKIGSIIVTNGDEYIGIITEKDILKLTFKEIDTTSNIEEFMTKPLVTVNEDELVATVIDIMKHRKIRRVVVINNAHEIIGILTNRDILKHIKGNYTRILQNKIKHAQEIMDFLPEAIIEIFDNENQQIIYWMNSKAKTSFNKDLLDKEITSLFNKDDWQRIYKKFKTEHSVTNEIIKISDSTYEISGTLSKSINSNYIKIIVKDVTIHEEEKTQLQKEIDKQIKKKLDNEYLLMQQSKLATMGEMIAHIAHQWRQPLAQLGGIFMNLEAAYSFNELNEEYLDQRVKNGNELLKYMSTTIDDFSSFFEPNREKIVFNVASYIQNAINIINASLTYNHINLEFINNQKEFKTLGFPSEFSQVILNILVNAKDALCKIIKKEKRLIKITLEEKDDFIIISISDNAGGVDQNIINDVFNMYVTSKKEKQGSGLGLYITKLIIETKLNGLITVENNSLGAIFTIKLPLK